MIWEELFFDLAFVFALTQFSRMLHGDHSWAGVGRVLLLFVTVYWAWAGTTIYTDQRNVDNALDRAGVFALGLGSLLLALMIPDAYGERGAIAIIIGYALVCALWWAYFIYGVRAFRQAVQRTAEQADIRRSVMVYGHLLFSFAIIMIAVGLAEVVTDPIEPLRAGEAGMLFGGAALFLTTFAQTHWQIHRQVAWRRISAGVLCLVLLPLAPLMPALAALAILLAVVAGVSVLEEIILRHPAASRVRASEDEMRGDPDTADAGPVVGN